MADNACLSAIAISGASQVGLGSLYDGHVAQLPGRFEHCLFNIVE